MKKLKKSILTLVCLSALVFIISGCQNSSAENNEYKPNKERLEDATRVIIGYGPSSYAAVVTTPEEIQQLEDLFNGAEFTKSDVEIQQPSLNITFYSEKVTTTYTIDEQDSITKGDSSSLKSAQIQFNQLYSIFEDYSSKKK